jgi:hypothetical protein
MMFKSNCKIKLIQLMIKIIRHLIIKVLKWLFKAQKKTTNFNKIFQKKKNKLVNFIIIIKIC